MSSLRIDFLNVVAKGSIKTADQNYASKNIHQAKSKANKISSHNF